MKVFVVGGTGLIGGHAARAIAAAGHEVTSLARSAAAEAKLAGWGIGAVPGDVADGDALASGAAAADAVVFAPSIGEAEVDVVRALLARMANTGKTFVFCSGTGVLGQRTAGAWSEDSFAESDEFTTPRSIQSRVDLENLVRGVSSTGLARGIVVRPPAVWSEEHPHALITNVVDSARKTGDACYIGAGLNMYSHVHAQDLGEVFRHVVERGVDGAVYHAVAGEVPNRWIADTVARHLGCPTRSITMDEAIELWGKFAALIVFGASSRSRSPRTRREFGWSPKNVDMLAVASEYLSSIAAKG